MKLIKRLHGRLNNGNKAYGTWHRKPFHQHVHWAVLVAYLITFSSISLSSFQVAYANPKIIGFDNRNARNESVGGQVEFIEMEVGEILSHGRSKDLIPTNLAGKKIRLKFVPDDGLISSIEYDDVVIGEPESGLGAAVFMALNNISAAVGNVLLAVGGPPTPPTPETPEAPEAPVIEAPTPEEAPAPETPTDLPPQAEEAASETAPVSESSDESSDSTISDENIEITLDEPATPPGWDKVLAIGDVRGFTFSKGRFSRIAQGKDLFKCLNWDFEGQQCLGRWQKIAKLIPGQEYTVEFAPGDPGYAESSRKVNALNKKKELLDYVETTPTAEAVTVVLTPTTSSVSATTIEAIPVQEITINEVDETSPNNDLIIDVVDITTDPIVQEAVIVDTTNLAAKETKITNKAKSNVLVACMNYEEIENTCTRWKKEKNIVPEEDFVVSISSPGKSVFGQSRDGILVLNKNLEVLPQSSQAIETGKVGVQFSDLNPYKITTYLDSTSTGTASTTQEIILDVGSETMETSNKKTMSFDLSSSSVSSADIDATAVGYDLFECDNFDLENQTCRGKYKKAKDLVRDQNYSFSVEKKDTASEFFESKKQITLLDKEGGLFDYNETVIGTATGTDVEITPASASIIKKIKIKNHLENTKNDLKINEDVPLPREDAVQSYAVDPTGLNATSELEIEAKGNALLKCKDWDFTNSTCLGTWEKIKTLNPGQAYTLPIDQADPGFMEVNEASVAPQVSTKRKISSSGGRISSSYYTNTPVNSNQLPATSSTTPTTSTAPTIPVSPSQATTINTGLNKNNAVIMAPKNEFKADLEFGSKGFEVKELQQFLNKNGFVVAQVGPGSAGQETNYFGPLTKAALKKFQQAFASKILEPLGLKSPTGILGPLTKQLINSL